MKKVIQYVIAILLAAFGLITLFLSSSVIFDLFGIRAKEGNYVLFIVWANLLSSILYLVAAYGFIKDKKWTIKPLGLSMIVLLMAFIGLFFYINSGGIYETKTIGAMLFRMTVTIVFTALAFFMISKKLKQ
jgi:drug/metabolite transporter (DMT)-like permease